MKPDEYTLAARVVTISKLLCTKYAPLGRTSIHRKLVQNTPHQLSAPEGGGVSKFRRLSSCIMGGFRKRRICKFSSIWFSPFTNPGFLSVVTFSLNKTDGTHAVCSRKVLSCFSFRAVYIPGFQDYVYVDIHAVFQYVFT